MHMLSPQAQFQACRTVLEDSDVDSNCLEETPYDGCRRRLRVGEIPRSGLCTLGGARGIGLEVPACIG